MLSYHLGNVTFIGGLIQFSQTSNLTLIMSVRQCGTGGGGICRVHTSPPCHLPRAEQ